MIDSEYKYDPRVTWIEDRYWITWCNGYHGPTIGIGYTFDFIGFLSSARMPSFLLIVMAYFSRRRLTVSMLC